MTANLTIGEIARQAGVRIDTVRFYEKRGLIPHPHRRPSGYRIFTEETVRRIRFIKRAQELGFTLDEISDLLALRVSRRARCADVMAIARHKADLIDTKIADLRAMRGALNHLMESCEGQQPAVDCPIIESLERNGTPPTSDSSRKRKS